MEFELLGMVFAWLRFLMEMKVVRPKVLVEMSFVVFQFYGVVFWKVSLVTLDVCFWLLVER